MDYFFPVRNAKWHIGGILGYSFEVRGSRRHPGDILGNFLSNHESNKQSLEMRVFLNIEIDH